MYIYILILGQTSTPYLIALFCLLLGIRLIKQCFSISPALAVLHMITMKMHKINLFMSMGDIRVYISFHKYIHIYILSIYIYRDI